MDGTFRFVDALGPSKVIEIAEGHTGLRAFLVIDNVARGPAIGGVRMARDVTLEECARLARAMTLKAAVADLPHGGAKSAIVGDPRMAEPEKELLIRAFALAIRDLVDYVPGPDMGVGEAAMAWIDDEIGRAIGRPEEIGGIPLDTIGATGLGVAVAAEEAAPAAGLDLVGARVVVQGFGAVGRHAARFLAERGAVLVAASDTSGTLVDPTGLDVDALVRHKEGGQGVTGFPRGEGRDLDAAIDIECEIWVPAARPDVITAATVERLATRMVVQGANIPVTPEAEAELHRRGVVVVPDFVANPGGLICGAVEYRGGGTAEAVALLQEKVRRNVGEVLAASRASGEPPRAAATALAVRRVRRAMALRRAL